MPISLSFLRLLLLCGLSLTGVEAAICAFTTDTLNISAATTSNPIKARSSDLASVTVLNGPETTSVITGLEFDLLSQLVELPVQPIVQRLSENTSESQAVAMDALYEIIGHGLFIEVWSARAQRAGYRMEEESQNNWRNGRGQRIGNFLTYIASESVPTVPDHLRRDLESRIPEPSQRSEARDVQYIFKLAKSGSTIIEKDAIKNEMEQARIRIMGGQPFDVVARQVSDAPSAPEGGRIGWVERTSQYNPRFIDLVFSTPTRTVSPVVELHNGFYLVQVTQERPAVSLEQDRQRVENELLAAAREYWIADIRSKADKEFGQLQGNQVPEPILRKLRSEGLADINLETALSIWDKHCLAVTYFDHVRRTQKLDEPTEEAVLHEYETNPIPYAKFGFWKLTRFLVPIGNSEARVGSLANASRHAENARQRLLDGVTDKDIREIFGGLAGLVVDQTEDWTRTSDQGVADIELTKTPVGKLTAVYTFSGGAVFYRKDEQRPIESKPFDEVAPLIRDGMRAASRDAALSRLKRSEVGMRANRLNIESLVQKYR